MAQTLEASNPSPKSIPYSLLPVKGARQTGAIGVLFIKISKVNSWINLFCPFSFPLWLNRTSPAHRNKSVWVTKKKEMNKISLGAIVWFQIKSVYFMREMCSSELIWVGGKATRIQQTNQIFKFCWRHSMESSVEPQMHEKPPPWGDKHSVFYTFQHSA